MKLQMVGCSHHNAPLEVRERLAFSPDQARTALVQLRAQFPETEAVLISTCNRVELYTVEDGTGRPGRGSATFFGEFFQVSDGSYINHLYRLYDEKAARHLFSVAASLDSMIVGEPQILGQVKEHFLKAQLAGTTGRVFNHLFAQALNLGKRVRSETAIGQMAVSVPYAAIELARKVFDNLEGKSAGLLGRGEMSELTAQHLLRAGVDNLYVVNRDLDKAIEFAGRVGGVPLVYQDDLDFLLHADILVCSTSAPNLLITPEPLHRVMSKRRNRLLLLIDISVPRQIDPAVNDLENVYLFNIDHLQKMTAENMKLRMEEARKASALIEDEVQKFLEWLGSLDVLPTICAFRELLERIRRGELSRVLKDFDGFAPEQKELVEQFSRALINKIGHVPTTKLKDVPNPERAMHYSSVLRDLFELDMSDTGSRED